MTSCERHIYQCSGVAVTVGGWQNGTVKSGSDDGHYHEHVSESQCCMIAAAVAVAEYTGKNIIKCHGGQYTITRKGYTWNVKAENMENSS